MDVLDVDTNCLRTIFIIFFIFTNDNDDDIGAFVKEPLFAEPTTSTACERSLEV